MRDRRPPRRAAVVRSEVAVWDLAARLLASRCGACSAGATSGCSPTPRPASWSRRGARAARLALARRGVRAVKLRFHHADWRDDVAVVEAVRDAVGGRWRSWSTPTTAGGCRRPRAAVGRRRRRSPAPGRSSRSASTGSRSRCRPATSTAARGCGPLTSLRIAAGEMVRSLHEARDLVLRGGVDVIQPDVVLAGGIGGGRRIAALADLCGRMWSPHTWSNGLGLLANLHLALGVSTCPFLEVPLDPPGWTPARRDWLLGGGDVLPIAPDGTVGAARRPGPRRRARPRRAGGAPRRHMRIRAAVLHAYGHAALRRGGRARPAAAPGEVLVRVAAAGVCHSDLTWPTGTSAPGRRPDRARPRGRRASSRPWAGVDARRAGRPRRVLLRPRLRALPPVRGRAAQPVRARGRARVGRDAARRDHPAAARRRPRRSSTSTSSPASPSGPSCRPRAAPCRRPLPLWQARCSAAAVVTGVGAVRNAARRRPGETVCVVGCGGVGLQLVAAARLAGAGRIVAVERDAGEARARARPRRDRRGRRGGADAVLAAVPRRRRPRVRGRRLARHHPAGLGRAAPGRDGDVVGIAPRRRRRAPALELLSEKGIRGATTARATPRRCSPRWRRSPPRAGSRSPTSSPTSPTSTGSSGVRRPAPRRGRATVAIVDEDLRARPRRARSPGGGERGPPHRPLTGAVFSPPDPPRWRARARPGRGDRAGRLAEPSTAPTAPPARREVASGSRRRVAGRPPPAGTRSTPGRRRGPVAARPIGVVAPSRPGTCPDHPLAAALMAAAVEAVRARRPPRPARRGCRTSPAARAGPARPRATSRRALHFTGPRPGARRLAPRFARSPRAERLNPRSSRRRPRPRRTASSPCTALAGQKCTRPSRAATRRWPRPAEPRRSRARVAIPGPTSAR